MTQRHRVSSVELRLGVHHGPTAPCERCEGVGTADPIDGPVMAARVQHRFDAVAARLLGKREPALVLPDPMPAPAVCGTCRGTGRVAKSDADAEMLSRSAGPSRLETMMLDTAARLLGPLDSA